MNVENRVKVRRG